MLLFNCVCAHVYLCACMQANLAAFGRVLSESGSLYKKKTEQDGRGCPVHAPVED